MHQVQRTISPEDRGASVFHGLEIYEMRKKFWYEQFSRFQINNKCKRVKQWKKIRSKQDSVYIFKFNKHLHPHPPTPTSMMCSGLLGVVREVDAELALHLCVEFGVFSFFLDLYTFLYTLHFFHGPFAVVVKKAHT